MKVRDQLWGKMFLLAVLFAILSLIGLIVAAAGLGQIPMCDGGQLDCYFFVMICGGYAMVDGVPNDSYNSCFWVQKNRAVEGSNGNNVSENLAMPIFTLVLAMIPCIMLIISTIIRNERCLFIVMESGKAFTVIAGSLLVVSMAHVDNLTFSCRWYKEIQHGNDEKCSSAYTLHTMGAGVLLGCQAMLLIFLIGYEEKHRKKVRNNNMVSVFSMGAVGGTNDAPASDPTRTKVKPMKIQVSGGGVPTSSNATGGNLTAPARDMWGTSTTIAQPTIQTNAAATMAPGVEADGVGEDAAPATPVVAAPPGPPPLAPPGPPPLTSAAPARSLGESSPTITSG